MVDVQVRFKKSTLMIRLLRSSRPPRLFQQHRPTAAVRRVCFHGAFSEDNRARRRREGSNADNPKLRDCCTVPVLRDVLATRQLLPTDSDMFGLEYLPAEPWRPS